MLSFDVVMNPTEHGYVECPHCSGCGSSLHEEENRCTFCEEGSGVVPLAKAEGYDPSEYPRHLG